MWEGVFVLEGRRTGRLGLFLLGLEGDTAGLRSTTESGIAVTASSSSNME
jgi:hypothetical protein